MANPPIAEPPVHSGQPITIPVQGMFCGNCSGSVTSEFQKLLETGELVDCSIFVDHETGLAIITPKKDLSPEGRAALSAKIKRLAIEEAGFEATDEDKKKKLHSSLAKGITGSVVGIILMALCFSGLGIPLAWMYGIFAGSTLLTLFLGYDCFYEAGKALVNDKRLTMDTLFSISTLTTVGVSLASFFFSWLSMMMGTAPLMLGCRHLGEAMKTSMKRKAASEVLLQQLPPMRVEAREDGSEGWEMRSVEEIQPGSTIRVKKGQVIPLDGICVTEKALVNVSAKSGSTISQTFTRGQPIYSGMIVSEDIEMRVTRHASESYLNKIDAEITLAEQAKKPKNKAFDKVFKYFVPTVLIVAAVAGIVAGVVFNPALAIQSVTSILSCACPCTLALCPSLGLMNGLSIASKNGVTFTTTAAIENADDIDTVVFDLNGTLTTGQPAVTRHQFAERISSEEEERLFRYLYSIESSSHHAIAKTISTFIKNKTPEISSINIDHNNLDTSDHSGIKAIIEGDHYFVGNAVFIRKHGIDLSSMGETMADDSSGQTIYFAKGTKVVSYTTVEDPLKPDAKSVIQALSKQGKTIYLCTGADQETAKRYATKLGIPENRLYADCASARDSQQLAKRTKRECIAKLQTQGKRVAMIGDGLNDVPAMVQADVSIAVKSSSSQPLIQHRADVTVGDTSLLPVLTTFTVARNTMKTVNQGMAASLLYNTTMLIITAGVFVALGFALNPGIGVALMVLQTALVLGYLRYRIQHQTIPTVTSEESTGSEKLGSVATILSELSSAPTPAPQATLSTEAASSVEPRNSQPAPSLPAYCAGFFNAFLGCFSGCSAGRQNRYEMKS